MSSTRSRTSTASIASCGVQCRFSASFNGGPEFEPDGYLTDYYTDQAVRVVEANRDRPFFLYLAHWAVHTPLQALKDDYDALSHIEEHRLRVYAAMVRSLDRSVGRVLAALRENGLEENTLVFFTSDNGAPAYIGLPRVNEPFRGWKISFFEGGIHVPFFVKWPARLNRRTDLRRPGPRLRHLRHGGGGSGCRTAPRPDDRRRRSRPLRHRRSGRVFPTSACSGAPAATRSFSPTATSSRSATRQGKTWLFHLPSDPTEQRNLADAAPERVAALEQLLAEHNAQQAAPLWPSAVVSPTNIDKTLLEPDAPDDDFIYWFN